MKPQPESTTKQFYDPTYNCIVATIDQTASNNCKHHIEIFDGTKQRFQRHALFLSLSYKVDTMSVTVTVCLIQPVQTVVPQHQFL